MKKTITLFSLILALGYLVVSMPVFGTTPEGKAFTLKEKISNIIDNIKARNQTENEVVAAEGKTIGKTAELNEYFAPKIIFVDASATSGSNDGTSWTDAYTDFQNAINNALPGDSIFVAKGTYQPLSGQSFIMAEGVKIYGSFQGTETSLSERNFALGDTTVLEGNGVSVIHNYNNGLTAAAILDGFKITGGSGATDNSGGIYNLSSSPTLNNLVISGNSGLWGGGMHNESNASPILTNLIIKGNTAVNNGGGIYNFTNSSPTLNNVTIDGNSVTGSGDTFTGGGISNFDNSNPVLDDVTITRNTAYEGGGIGNDNSSPILTNVTVSGNSAVDLGGGILNNNSSSPTITDVIISGNTSTYGAGVFNYNTSSPILINVAITGNNASQFGGGIGANISSPATLTNVTISGNNAGGVNGGGGIYNGDAISSPTLNNSIVLGNSSGVEGNPINSISANYVIETTGGNADYNDGTTTTSTALLSTDVFVLPEAPANAPTILGDYSLKTGSFAIDKGNNALYPTPPGLDETTKDLAGNPRVFNYASSGIIDLGAYEYQGSLVPLKLVSFSAVKGNENVLLSWSTATESNVDRFEVERSTDGNNFGAIGSVKATGNSSVLQNYHYTDPNPVNGNNFYRLKMIDLDGHSTYSSVATVRFTGSSSWKLSPNPATSFITLQASSTVSIRTLLNVYSSGGKEVGRYSLNPGDQMLKINVDNLPSGTYFLEINNQNGKETIPFVKK